MRHHGRQGAVVMLDFIFIAAGVAFFGGAIWLTYWLDRLDSQPGVGGGR
jgi:hypothetical protein